MSVLSYSAKMLLNHSTCKIFKNGFCFVILRIKAIISDRNGAILMLGKWKVHFLPPLGIENNAKFNIAFFSRNIRRIFLSKMIPLFLELYSQLG